MGEMEAFSIIVLIFIVQPKSPLDKFAITISQLLQLTINMFTIIKKTILVGILGAQSKLKNYYKIIK